MTQLKKAKLGCHICSFSQAIVTNITPILFIPIKELYNISYSMLAGLVLVNFITQLLVDLIYSFFSHKLSIEKSIRYTPLITSLGLILFAISPIILPKNIYLGLILGTIVLSASGGLIEVLASPVVATIPSENSEREMSKLHSFYALGVVFVVIITTFLLMILGKENWIYITICWALVPFVAFILFYKAPLSHLESEDKGEGILKLLKSPYFIICFLCIFLGGATERNMAQWSSSFLEKSIGINKTVGDILGVAMFGVTLGIGRMLYTKYGKNIYIILFLGSLFSSISYLIISFINIPIVSIITCALTGLFVSMLWPGTLIACSDGFPKGGVVMFTLMASAGDLGISFGSFVVGNFTDYLITNSISESLSLRGGMLLGSIFPILSVFTFLLLLKNRKDKKV